MNEVSAAELRDTLTSARVLRSQAPTWRLGIEEPGVARTLASALAGHASASEHAARLAAPLAAWAFSRRPLDRDLAATAGSSPGLPAPLCALAKAVHSRTALEAPESDVRGIGELLDAGEAALCTRHLMPRLMDPAQGPGWLALAWERLLRMGSPDLPLSLLEATRMEEGLAPLATHLRAQWAMLYLDPAEATEHVTAMDDTLFGPLKRYMLAELALRRGDTETGTIALAQLWREMPWHPLLTHKLATLLQPAPTPPADLSDTCVLLYSWNKADLLGDTLENLANTDLRGARVFVLDNGSTDHMSERIHAAQRLFPEGTLTSVTLPVNVGAPAARNWLLSLPEVRACAWAAFLDDDVIIPDNWLTHLRAAAEETGADVVGCRVIAASPPHTVQSADYHLLPPNDEVKTFVDYPERIMVFDNCRNDFDLGLFTYERPATSVSGCCHLLSMRGVEAYGDFDIRFTPTQFDDLERDLRLGVAGMHIHYAGSLSIRHIQHSSLAKAQSLGSIGHVFGNKIKLEGKYDPDEIKALQARMADRLEEELQAAENRLLASIT